MQYPKSPTLWQRFWRSPWTWLLFTINGVNLVFGSHPHQSVGWTIFNWVVLVVCGLRFFRAADERWGKP